MKVCLLYPKEYDLSNVKYYSNRNDLIKDLRLNQLCHYMSKKDSYIDTVMIRVMMAPLLEKEIIHYRHEVMKDCMEHFAEFEEIYQICKMCMERTHAYIKEYCGRKSIVTAKTILEGVKSYQQIMDDSMKLQGILEGMQVSSKGLHDLREQMVQEHGRYPVINLEQLKNEIEYLEGGGAHQLYLHLALGNGFKLKNAYIEEIVMTEDGKGIRESIKKTAKSVIGSFFGSANVLDIDDVSVYRELEEAKTIGLEQIHKIYLELIKGAFPLFEQVRSEVAFYMGGYHYYHTFRMKGLPMCFPKVLSGQEKQIGFGALYEPVLGYTESSVVVTNDCPCRIAGATIITGANQGGKSTYLKSIGIAQVLMQCGLCVNGNAYESSLYDEIFTHFSRREDRTMTRSRFEEELMRFDEIFHHITKNSMLLMNESFASTTEEEGSALAEDLTRVLYDEKIPLFFVSHLYQYAIGMYQQKLPEIQFLNAERKSDGTRTFKMVEQPPNHTSYGMDLFDALIGI